MISTLWQIIRSVLLVRSDFKEYNKITGSVEEKVNSTSTDKKALLQPALGSLIDTIKRQPDIFSNLLRMSTGAPVWSKLFFSIYQWTISRIWGSLCWNFQIYGIRRSEKLYDKMVKDLVNAIMGDITSTNRSISPPPLPVQNIFNK